MSAALCMIFASDPTGRVQELSIRIPGATEPRVGFPRLSSNPQTE